MSDFHGKIILLPPNRVWRSYQGGRTLDSLAGHEGPGDSHFPEDWIASTVRAVNPTPHIRSEVGEIGSVVDGVSQVLVGGRQHDFAGLIAKDPGYFFGSAHVTRFGAEPHLLVKLLDPAIRLHFQVHPTTDFARRFLNAPSGKTEAYHILEIRPEVEQPYLYIGFQRPPGREALRRMIEQQDIAALEGCFDRIPVKTGDTYLVPGGVPHALGEGILLAEIQEPSDLVVRAEFARGGYVLAEQARFMNRGLDFCLDIFDQTPWPLSRLATEVFCLPHRRRALGPNSFQTDLIDQRRTACFRVRQSHFRGEVVKDEDSCYIGIITSGECRVSAGGETHLLKRYDKIFCPAGLGAIHFQPGSTATLLECYPPAE